MFRLGLRRALLAGGVLFAFASGLDAQIAAQTVSPPDFSPSRNVGWVGIGSTEFLRPPSGPGPVVHDPGYPRISNAVAAATGQQPTFPVADLSNPLLQPWVREELRKRNERVFAGGNGSASKLLAHGNARIGVTSGSTDLLYPHADQSDDGLARLSSSPPLLS